MGALYDENGNEVGYLYDGGSRDSGKILLFWMLVVLPVLAWIFMIKLVFDGDTSADDRMRYILIAATVIITAVIGGKVVFGKKTLAFKGAWVGLVAFTTVVSGIVIRLIAMDERGILAAVFGFAFILAVAPASVVACAVYREEAKEFIKTKMEDLMYLLRNLKEMVVSVLSSDK